MIHHPPWGKEENHDSTNDMHKNGPDIHAVEHAGNKYKSIPKLQPAEV